jgi:hypothetical protein
MSGRTDRKLREVAVGRYGYRYEAEFAAGFLEDARIPYRLQVDDASLGISLSASAIIWVHAMDESRAREILETDENGGPVPSLGPVGEPAAEPLAVAGEAELAAERQLFAATRAEAAGSPAGGLEARERLIAAATAAGLLGFARYGLFPGRAIIVVSTLAAVALFLVALSGRAPRFLRSLLATLSGNAP